MYILSHLFIIPFTKLYNNIIFSFNSKKFTHYFSLVNTYFLYISIYNFLVYIDFFDFNIVIHPLDNVTMLCYTVDNDKGVLNLTERLISKKDLLISTNISYGQLYRWKRKKLIPEAWFIRKSTFTGQETFFPHDKILERIEKIQSMKDNLSLDELANMFSPHSDSFSFDKEKLLTSGIISETALHLYLEQINHIDNLFTFQHILPISITDYLLKEGTINLDEGKMIIQLLHDYFIKLNSSEAQLIITRKLGVTSCLIAPKSDTLFFETNMKVITTIDFLQATEELKTMLI